MDRATYDNMAKIDQDHWWFVARRKIIATLIECLDTMAGEMNLPVNR